MCIYALTYINIDYIKTILEPYKSELCYLGWATVSWA